MNVIFRNWKYKWKERKNWRWIRFETEKIASPKKECLEPPLLPSSSNISSSHNMKLWWMDIVSPHIRATNPFLFKYRCNIYFESYLKRHIFSFFFISFSFNIKFFFFFFVQRDDVRNFERIVKSKYRVKWKHRIIDNAWRKACPIAKKVQQASASFKVKVYAWNSSYASRVPRSPLLQRTLFRSLHQTDLQPARNIRDSWLANWSSYVRNTSVELSSPGNNTDVDISMDPMQCNRFF